jgi:hypothetical protein
MAIEIKELQIKAVVEPDPAGRQPAFTQAALDRLKKEILRECLQEVKTFLKEQQER